MSWVTIILQIASILPELITDVENIIAAIMGKSAAEQASAQAALTAALATKDPAQIKSAIDALK